MKKIIEQNLLIEPGNIAKNSMDKNIVIRLSADDNEKLRKILKKMNIKASVFFREAINQNYEKYCK